MRFVLFLLTSAAYGQGVISSVVGTEYLLNPNRQAKDVPIGRIENATIDPAGRIVFSDPNSNMVLRLLEDGNLETLAGNGLPGYSGDDSYAVKASLDGPQGVVFDSAGNLYIADQYNHRVRRVSPDGIVTTFAGNGRGQYTGDGGRAELASLNEPYALAYDQTSGSLYINDRLNGRIRRVSAAGVITTLFVTAQSACLSDVIGIGVDRNGSVYYADEGCNVVQRISPNGSVVTVAGQMGRNGFGGDRGLAVNALLNTPAGLAVDQSDAVYLSDMNNLRVRRIGTDGVIDTVAGSGAMGFSGDGGAARSASLRAPMGLAVDSTGALYIADRDNFRLRRVASGVITTAAGSGLFLADGDGTPALRFSLLQPFGVAVDSSGALYVVENGNNRVVRVGRDGRVFTVAGNGGNEYSGDGGQAVRAGLANPIGVAVGPDGAVYIADTNSRRVRRVAGGIIRTFAGGGTNTGVDNLPATSLKLEFPFDVAVDREGLVYVTDTYASRIWRVTQGGIATLFAGTGTAGFSGDGGQARQAQLNVPVGVAVDGDGNVYVADAFNRRIRKISRDGVITSIAGGGTMGGASADGGPATRAALGRPSGVEVDAQGNVYFSDSAQSFQRIGRVSTSGIITTAAGTGARGFAGDGGLATRATMNNPFGVAADIDGNVYFADVYNNRIRQVSNVRTAPSLEVSRTGISFDAQSRGPATEPEKFSVESSMAGLLFNVSVDRAAAGWLRTSVSSGSTPGRDLQVIADPASLSAGTYRGTITVSAPSSNPPSRSVAVTFRVSSAVPPKLTVEGRGLAFAFTRGAKRLERQMAVANTGGGTLEYAVETSGEPWLTVDPSTGFATPAEAGRVVVAVDSTGLEPRTYTATVKIRDVQSGARVEIPVDVTVSSARGKLLLSQTGLKFTAASGGAMPLSKTIAVLNAGDGDLTLSLEVNKLGGAADWLQAYSYSDTLQAESQDIAVVDVSVLPGELEAGDYYGRIRIISPEADNSPQTVTVMLTVLPPGQEPGPEVRPSSLVFTGRPGSVPGSQDVLLSNAGTTSLTYVSNRSDDELRNWLTHGPVNGVVRPGEPARLVIQPSLEFANLPSGIRRGQVNVQFSDGSVQPICVLAMVGTEEADRQNPREAGSCFLQVAFTSLQPNFAVAPGQTVSIQTQIVNRCDNRPFVPVSGEVSRVLVHFTNNNQQLPLTHRGDGQWETTWVPPATAGPVTLIIFADGGTALRPARNEADGTRLSGSIRQALNSDPPRTRALRDGASLEERDFLAPGSVITIFGERLAAGDASVGGLPWPLEMGETAVELGGRELPLLYVSEGQINAQAPYDLVVNTRHQLLVRRGDTSSVAMDVTVAEAKPAIYTVNQQGFGQGIITKPNVEGAPIADASAPAARGELVRLYCNGLGRVSPDISPGTPTPEVPERRPMRPVLVTIGGLTATVTSVALQTGNAGSYLVDAIVPDDVTPGDAVSVTVSSVGLTSREVTMAIR